VGTVLHAISELSVQPRDIKPVVTIAQSGHIKTNTVQLHVKIVELGQLEVTQRQPEVGGVSLVHPDNTLINKAAVLYHQIVKVVELGRIGPGMTLEVCVRNVQLGHISPVQMAPQ
jgi:hypothetical protein